MNTASAAKALGWFSIGLGAAELIAPRWLQHQLGTTRHGLFTRAFGVREVLTGVAILRNSQSSTWVWARVAGDLMDIAALSATAMKSPNRGRVGAAIAMVAAVTVVDAVVAKALQQATATRGRPGEDTPAEQSGSDAAPSRRRSQSRNASKTQSARDS